MSIVTEHYKLRAFMGEDIYSASIDQRRIRTIDNQLAFLSDRCGEGRIYGWKIKVDDVTEKSLKVTSGIGIIDRQVYISYGSLKFNVDNQKKYIYIQNISDDGGISGFSNIAYIEATNTDAPSSPQNLQPVEDLITYNKIAFNWDANIEKDFDHYKINKIVEDEYEIIKKIASTKETVFIDKDLRPNTLYKYQVIAVDMSGNESECSEIEISTLQDLTPPLPPTYVDVISQNNGAQIIWNNSPSYNVNRYLIEIYNDNDLIEEHYVDEDKKSNSGQLIIDDLINNNKYHVYIYSISDADVLSESIIKTVYPYNYTDIGNIKELNVDIYKSVFEGVCLEAKVEWYYAEDEYFDSSELQGFIIEFIKMGEERSEQIVLDKDSVYDGQGVYSSIIRYIPYRDEDNKKYYQTIASFDSYSIIVKTIDINGNIGKGMMDRVNQTPVCEQVSQIEDFSFDKKTNNLVYLSWQNPTEDFFDHLKITCTITDVSKFDEDDVVYVEDYDIGKSSSFSIPREYFKINSRYNIEIVPYDVFGDAGKVFAHTESFLDTDSDLSPEPPTSLSIQTSNGIMKLSWRHSLSNELQYYNIYRAEDSLYLSASDFILLNSISKEHNYYIDYTVEKNKKYVYIVSAQNIYNKESTNPVDDGVMTGAIKGSLKVGGTIDDPSNLKVIQQDDNIYNVKLTWDVTGGDYDGYEIYRSKGNDYEFKLIDTIDKFQDSYIDEDVLLEDGQQYYYMIRKFKNDINLYTTYSKISPQDCLYIGSVYIDLNDNIIIDESGVRDLSDYFSPLKDIIDERIKNHKHTYQNNFDKRIELRGDITIDNWNTHNYITYATDKNIEGASQHMVKIEGDVNEDFFKKNGATDEIALKQAQSGLSPVDYEIDTENQKIVFNSPLYTTCKEEFDPLNPNKENCPIVLYLNEAIISVTLIGVSEVKNTLSNNRIEDIYANQINSGYVNNSLPAINHDGRIKEKLYPIKLSTATSDSVTYELNYEYNDIDRNKIGSSISFYDFCLIMDNRMFAASSKGLLYSEDNGNSWESVFTTDFPMHTIYKSNDNRYFILTNYNIYINDGTVDSWKK
ncbi:MAG: fibronectin type III domain-containing protein, partial [bacterium]